MDRGHAMRWFYAFLLLLMAWGGIAQTLLKDDPPEWKAWDQPR